MTNQSVQEAQAQETGVSPRKGKISSAKDTLSFLNTAIPVIGAAGTLTVWLTANFYVGEVDIIQKQEVKDISIAVFDKKGERGTYHTPKFELMPGNYRVEVSTAPNNKYIADASVRFRQKTVIELPDQLPSNVVSVEQKKEKHWWQFWRHGS